MWFSSKTWDSNFWGSWFIPKSRPGSMPFCYWAQRKRTRDFCLDSIYSQVQIPDVPHNLSTIKAALLPRIPGTTSQNWQIVVSGSIMCKYHKKVIWPPASTTIKRTYKHHSRKNTCTATILGRNYNPVLWLRVWLPYPQPQKHVCKHHGVHTSVSNHICVSITTWYPIPDEHHS